MSLDLTDGKSTLWLGAVKQQAIIWANVDPDLCRHITLLGHNESKWLAILFKMFDFYFIFLSFIQRTLSTR